MMTLTLGDIQRNGAHGAEGGENANDEPERRHFLLGWVENDDGNNDNHNSK